MPYRICRIHQKCLDPVGLALIVELSLDGFEQTNVGHSWNEDGGFALFLLFHGPGERECRFAVFPGIRIAEDIEQRKGKTHTGQFYGRHVFVADAVLNIFPGLFGFMVVFAAHQPATRFIDAADERLYDCLQAALAYEVVISCSHPSGIDQCRSGLSEFNSNTTNLCCRNISNGGGPLRSEGS